MIELLLKNEEEVNPTLYITEEHLVKKLGKEIKKETTEYQIKVKISQIVNESRLVSWEVSKVKQKFFNVPKDEKDKFDKILKGVILKFVVNHKGLIQKFDNSLKAYRTIRVNTKKSVAKNLNIGMQPQDEEIIEELYRDSLEWIYMEELLSFVKKYHNKYGLTIPINQQLTTTGKFNRKIAKDNIPSIDHIKSNLSLCKTKIEYNLIKEMNFDKTLDIFNKEEELFRPFSKEKLKESILKKEFVCRSEERLRYDIAIGLVNMVSLKSIVTFGKTITEDNLRFEIK